MGARFPLLSVPPTTRRGTPCECPVLPNSQFPPPPVGAPLVGAQFPPTLSSPPVGAPLVGARYPQLSVPLTTRRGTPCGCPVTQTLSSPPVRPPLVTVPFPSHSTLYQKRTDSHLFPFPRAIPTTSTPQTPARILPIRLPIHSVIRNILLDQTQLPLIPHNALKIISLPQPPTIRPPTLLPNTDTVLYSRHRLERTNNLP